MLGGMLLIQPEECSHVFGNVSAENLTDLKCMKCGLIAEYAKSTYNAFLKERYAELLRKDRKVNLGTLGGRR